jgi:putative oxidoreductase
MFSMFPDGWPGAGLLLLRIAAGAVLIIQGIAYFGDRNELGFLVLAVASVMIAVGLLLLTGLLTRLVAIAAAIVGVSGVSPWLPKVSTDPFVNPTTATLFAAIAFAVICLGPGAFSLDARLFGRREIIIPARSAKE